MDRKTFIKLSSTTMAGTFIKPDPLFLQEKELTNWAGNFTFSTNNLFYPKSVTELQALVKKYPKVKALGTRHCFNRIADSKHNLISVKEMDEEILIDESAHTVTINGGMKYGKLAPFLDSKGFALHNLASLPHISVAGAIATATHGSGEKNGNLSSAVSAIEIVTAAGDVITLSKEKDGEKFFASVVGLGALGIVTKVTLHILPTYMVRQDVYEKLPLEELKDHFHEIEESGYSVSLFTDWQKESINEVWIKTKIEEGKTYNFSNEFFGAKAATKNLHPIAELSAENCTEQMGVPGPWYERLPHFKMGFTPSSGKELQTEYFVPIENGVAAILAIQKLGKLIGPHLFISEIRTIDADELWMSPCYKQQSMTIHFTWKQDWPAVQKLLPVIEKELVPFNAKPHWGKLFTMPYSRLQVLHKKMNDFRELAASMDPKGKFRNDFLNRNVFG
ncbi:MAG: D-arabinono-1,4-lactone oxidase [Ginsengibacter sp.]